MTMVNMRCPFPSCQEEIVNEDKEIAIALFNAHVSTHTVANRPQGSSSSSKSEKLTRPKLSQGMLEESWNSFEKSHSHSDTLETKPGESE